MRRCSPWRAMCLRACSTSGSSGMTRGYAQPPRWSERLIHRLTRCDLGMSNSQPELELKWVLAQARWPALGSEHGLIEVQVQLGDLAIGALVETVVEVSEPDGLPACNGLPLGHQRCRNLCDGRALAGGGRRPRKWFETARW